MVDYVHPGYVTSRTDGQRHYVSASSLVALYGLHPGRVRVVPSGFDYPMGCKPMAGDRHFYPRADGDYREDNHA